MILPRIPTPAIDILPLPPSHRNQLTITSNFSKEIDKSNKKKMENHKRIEKEEKERNPLRVLCLHGFRTSGEILKKQVLTKWPESVVKKMDLVFVDAPFPCTGKSDVEGFFDPPYYEWYQFDKETTEYRNFDECLEYVEDIMMKQGPFDGLLGFSQGGILSAGLPALQSKGLALMRVPKIKFVIVIGGAMFQSPAIADKAYSPSSRVQCPSLHFLGQKDFMKRYGEKLLELYVDPVVIHHPEGHIVPCLDEKGLKTMLEFLEKIHQQTNDTHLVVAKN